MDLVKALDVSVEFPTLRTLRRPGKSETELLVTLSLGAQCRDIFFGLLRFHRSQCCSGAKMLV
ncbi:hypothetical protein G039_0333000 [Pseudomonas aeruginosa VRFPA01]|nr:hypothetical protein G039_0333000 [Pseudomonas aeruginosa VRFPA01]